MTKDLLLKEIKRIEKNIKNLEKKYELATPPKPPEIITAITKYSSFQISEPFVKVTKATARKIVEELNKDKYGGYGDWRLPSIAECFLIDEVCPIFRSKKWYTHDSTKYVIGICKDGYITTWKSESMHEDTKQALFIRNVKENNGQANDQEGNKRDDSSPEDGRE